MNKHVEVIHLGRIAYGDAWVYQRKLFDQTLERKKENQRLPIQKKLPTSNYLLVCEHPHVITLGRNGKAKNLLLTEEQLLKLGIPYYHVERGGDITYHGPGQVVIYPVIDMENFFTDIRRYMHTLEEAVIQTLKGYAIPSGRIDTLTGVWVSSEHPAKAKKICAFGVKTSRWVTLHGMALNVNVDLNYFDYIIPCGIENRTVTSMEQELQKKQDIERVSSKLLNNICSLFGMKVAS